MNAKELALLLLLGAIWGLSYVFIRVAAPVLGPAVLMGLRFTIGGAAILAYVAAQGRARPALADLRHYLPAFLVGGLFFAALPTTLIGFAELRITASLATVLNASTPFFAAIGSVIWLREAFPARRVAGLLLGFLGVAVAVGTNGLSLSLGLGLSVAASITAAACYGLYGVYLRRSALPVRGVSFSLGTQLMAAVLLVGPAAVTYRPFAWTTPVLGATLGLALASTAFAYLLYHYLIEHVGATQTSTVTFVSPVFGILAAAVLLGEPIGLGLVVGLALIVLGILLSAPTAGRAAPTERRGAGSSPPGPRASFPES